MNRYVLIVLGLFLFGWTAANAQTKNFSYFKLIVLNDDDQMLLVNFKDQWEPAGLKYDSPATMRTVLEEMAAEMGVTIGDTDLRALVGKYYGEGKHPVLYNYVTARYQSGEPKVPPGCKDIRWFDIQEGIDTIPFKPMQWIMRKIFSEPDDTLWGGAVRIHRAPGEESRMEIIEELYEF